MTALSLCCNLGTDHVPLLEVLDNSCSAVTGATLRADPDEVAGAIARCLEAVRAGRAAILGPG